MRPIIPFLDKSRQNVTFPVKKNKTCTGLIFLCPLFYFIALFSFALFWDSKIRLRHRC